jgi:hypothetical protein
MAKLARKLQRVFGDTGGTGEFGQIGSKAAGAPTTTKDLDTIQSLAEYLQGYLAIVSDQGTAQLPYSEDLNSLFFLATTQLAYLFQNGIPEWLNSADQRYYADVSFVVRSGRIYKAIQGDDGLNINTQKDPLTEPTWWVDYIAETVFPVGSEYQQYPNGSTPATLGYPGTWTAEFETEGIAFRTPGGNALAFGGGIQEDQMQGHWHENYYEQVNLSGPGSAIQYDNTTGLNNIQGANDITRDAISDGVNGTPRIGNETRMRNRTFRTWRRTA